MSAVLSKTARASTTHIIDCYYADPFVPAGWLQNIEMHQKSKALQWNAAQVELFLPLAQRRRVIGGHLLRKLLGRKTVLNANVLDYLLENPQLVPDEWKNKPIFFWGTIYRDSDCGLAVRCLAWDDQCGGGWYWNVGWLDGFFDGDDPAAVLAS